MTDTKMISANGISIRYSDEGPKDAPVVVMSHSLSAELAMWDPQAEVLMEDFRVIRYDTRGHGGTDAPVGPYSLEMLADDAVGLLDGLGLSKVHWVGLSMGGMIGQTLGLRAPERLLSLTLADTSAGYPAAASAMWSDRIKAARENGMAAGVEGTMERWFSPGFMASGAPVLDDVRRMIASTPVEGYCGCGAAISNLAVEPRLGEIKLPTLVICGEDDQATPLSMSETIRDGIPGAKLAVLPVARHLANLEDVGGFNAAMMSFLNAQK